MTWGILAPDAVVSLRRQQNLGLAAAVRYHNDSAVPGLGGMWFAMPILWSVLAVSIAEELTQSALPVGNAVEALMMRHARNGPADRRVRGARKMQGLNDWSFCNLTRRGTYVVQPIRMAMVQPLVALGFVKGSRYGAFRMHEAGRRMLDLPVMQESRRILCAWARGGNPHGLADISNLLSPTAEVPQEVRKLIHAQMVQGHDESARRRRNLIALGTGPTAEQLEQPNPLAGIEPDHWVDLRAGAAFMDLRDAALAVLYRIEQRLRALRDANEPVRLLTDEAAKVAKDEILVLRNLVRSAGPRIAASNDGVSRVFLTEIETLSGAAMPARLAQRDRTVIALRGDHLALGPAAGDSRAEAGEDENRPIAKDEAFAPQLFRLNNLHCLARELETGINPGSPSAGGA